MYDFLIIVRTDCITEWMKDTGELKEEILSFEDLSNYRGERKIEVLDIWCTYFFPSVVGSWHFKSMATKYRLSDYFSVSDEAFAVTVIENFYDRWKKEGSYKAENEDYDVDDLPSAKWTDTVGSVGKKSRGGWSNEGLERFNTYMTNIKNLRNTENSVKLEEAYKEKMQDEEGMEKRRAGATRFKRVLDEVVTFDDFSPVQEVKKRSGDGDGKRAHTEKKIVRKLENMYSGKENHHYDDEEEDENEQSDDGEDDEADNSSDDNN